MPTLSHFSSTKLLMMLATASLLLYGFGRDAKAQAHPQTLSTNKIDIKVVGGRKVEPMESPWQVALVSAGAINHVDGVFCGGALLDSQWVLTAAHCLYDPKTCIKLTPQSFYVAYGSTDLGKRVTLDAPAELHHPKGYDCRSKNYDIALIKLQEQVSMMPAITLPQPSDMATLAAPGSRLLTTGWGLTDINGWKSRELLEVEVPVVDFATCKARYGTALPDGAICAGETGKDACRGDSGGPLYKRKSGINAVLLGIVSFGDGCGNAKSPGVYTAITMYLDWIEETRKAKSCTLTDIASGAC